MGASWVAPYVGAWIETTNILVAITMEVVAPYVGAWIETNLAARCDENL